MLSFLRVSLCLLIGSSLAVSCHSEPHSPPASHPTSVIPYSIEPVTMPITFDFVGFTESSHAVEIRGRVEGYLDQIHYEEGSRVGKGDVLFSIDKSQYQAQVDRSAAGVMKQQALLENAQVTLNRLVSANDGKAVSQHELDDAYANVRSAEASLKAAQAELLEAEINLGYTEIHSPIDGISDKSAFREGSLITPGKDNLLTTIYQLDPIWIYFTISDSQMAAFQRLMAERSHSSDAVSEGYVEAYFSDGSPYSQRGKIDFQSPSYKQSTATLTLRASFPNPDSALRPGQFMRLKVFMGERKNVLQAPQRAVIQKKGGSFVYLIGKDNTIIAQDVELGDWYGEKIIVEKGLKIGDRIVMDGTNKVREGQRITLVSTESEALR